MTMLFSARRAAVVLLVVLGACGADDGSAADDTSPATPDDVTDAAAATLEASSMSFELDFRISGDGIDAGGHLDGQGDFENGRGSVVAESGGVEATSVFDGDRFWLRSTDGTFEAALPDDAGWVAGSLAALGDDAAVTRLEPPALLYLLAGAGDASVSRANDRLEYRFAIDLDAAVDQAPADRREEVAALVEPGDAPAAVEGTAVVGIDGRVRALSIVAAVDTEDGSVDISYDARFGDFDEPVEVEPPAADEVVDLDQVPELQAQVAGG